MGINLGAQSISRSGDPPSKPLHSQILRHTCREGLVGSLATLALSAWILYYLVASMGHFYEDGWMRTLFKAFLLCVLYMVVFTPIYFVVVAAGM